MKKCIKCGIKKPLDDFYKHSRMKDGRLNICKECHKKDQKENRLNNIEYYVEYEKLRNQLPHRIKARKEYQKNNQKIHLSVNKRYRYRHQDKYKATNAVNNALRDGKIFKQPCLFCGDKKVQAHHEDYSRPLDVIWLCIRCHSKLHFIKRMNGEVKKVG